MINNTKKILIVDDEQKINDVVKSYLENSGYKAYQAYTGNQALELYENVGPNLVILDLMLPDKSGEEVCNILRKKSRVPIIMLTAKIEEENILNGLQIGADDYVTKPFSPRQLVARVEALLRRTEDEGMLLTDNLSFHNDDLVIDLKNHIVIKHGVKTNLTPNEYKLLASMAKYPKKAFTRDELITIVIGEDFEGFDRTIDTHIKNLRQKIETDSKNPQYIITVHGIGYRFGGE
jgi:Response regulators consisting of a CheY-like receiver domain and a winged-helix DNA-binding domain